MAIRDLAVQTDTAVKARTILLCLMTILAGWLRFTATSFGLPDKYRPDEEYVVSRSLGFDLDWNPHFATYPAAQIYLDHLALVLAAKLAGNHSNFREGYVGDNGAGAYLVARRVSAALGTATIPSIYVAAAPFGPEAAIAAAAIMTVSTLHVRESKYATTDAGAIFWLVLCLAMVMRMVFAGRETDYLMAGCFAGLAVATKYPAGAVIAAIVVGHLEARAHEGRSIRKSLLDIRIYLAGFATLVTFLCATPYFVLDWGQTVHDYQYQRGFVLDGLPNPLATYKWSWLMLHAAPVAYGYALMGLFIGATSWTVLRRKPGTLALLAFAVACVLPLIQSRYLFYRYLVFPLPGFVLLAAALAPDLIESIRIRLGFIGARIIVLVGITLLLLPSIDNDLELNRLLLRDDTRTIGRRWIEANIPPGAEIAVSDVGNLCGKPQLPQSYHYVPLQPLDMLKKEGVQWVLSDSLPAIVFYSKGVSQKEMAELSSLATQMLDINPIKPDRPPPKYDPVDAYYAPLANISSAERAGPRIRIWRLR